MNLEIQKEESIGCE